MYSWACPIADLYVRFAHSRQIVQVANTHHVNVGFQKPVLAIILPPMD